MTKIYYIAFYDRDDATDHSLRHVYHDSYYFTSKAQARKYAEKKLKESLAIAEIFNGYRIDSLEPYYRKNIGGHHT